MTERRRRRVDPVESEIEAALAPGRFIPDRTSFTFVSELEGVAPTVAKLISIEPARAVGLYESFLAGCYEKAEEVDDSSGSFGQFVSELFCGWIGARQTAGADPEVTATRLLQFIDDDPYGFSQGAETAAAKVFDKAGVAAFEKQVRARFDAAATEPADYPRRHWGEVLLSLYLTRNNLTAYIALSETTGLTAKDCHAIARMLVARRKLGEALAWVERGIGFDTTRASVDLVGHDLAGLRRVLLSKLGRGGEALESAWAVYRKRPSQYTYDDLMKFVPKNERAAWHEKAMDAIEGGDLRSVIELLLETKEMERLAERVRRSQDGVLQDLSHYVTEPAAKRLEKIHPDLAARLWRAQGMRIVDAKKSKYYEAALSNFENAMRCFGQAGLTAEWAKTVNDIRSRHHRKSGFMSGFERLLAGSGPSDEPSFLERARARWSRRETEAP
jgi:hypothetical protein